MSNSGQASQREHIVWLDIVRFAAVFMVVACHCTDPFNAVSGNAGNEAYSFWGTIYGSLLRPCVPLFVMITGVLLLPVRQEASQFYKKRISRVAIPFLIWSVLYNLFPWIVQLFGGTAELVNRFFPYAPDPSSAFSSALHDIILIPFNFSGYTVHLWYVYMLIGLYLYMPLFSAWVEKATEKAKLRFLILWGVTLLIPYVQRFLTGNLWGTCSWNGFGMLYYFAGFNGYLLLGHYLAKGTNLSVARTWMVAVPMFVVGYVITAVGFAEMKALPNATENDYELFFTYCSLNVVLMTLAVFMVLQKVRISSPLMCRLLANLTKCGFGIYLIHYFFVGIGYSVALGLNVPVGLIVPLAAVIAFAIAWGVVALLCRLPYAKWILG